MLMNMKEILDIANENYFAVPAFNISDYSMFNGIMDAVEEKKSPVIIAIHPDEINHMEEYVMASVRERIYNSSVPACIHLDHGSSLEQIIFAVKAGYTSVMIDGSALSFEENINISKKAVEIAHAVNISVEGELGTIGTADLEGEEGADEIIYTNPDDAAEFVKSSGVDMLAIAIGTSHGLYPGNMQPKLKLELLKKIKEKVSVPLVLHGGSGNSDEEIRRSVELGINKINISSDIKAAYFDKMREVLTDRKLREPNKIQPDCIKVMKEVAYHKIDLFKSNGKAELY